MAKKKEDIDLSMFEDSDKKKDTSELDLSMFPDKSGFRTVAEKGKLPSTESIYQKTEPEEFDTSQEKIIEYQEEQKKQEELQQEDYAESYLGLINEMLSSLDSKYDKLRSLESDWYGKKSIESGDWLPVTSEDIKESNRLNSIPYNDLMDQIEEERAKLSRIDKTKYILEDAKNYIETKDDNFLKSLINNLDSDLVTAGMSSVIKDFDIVGIARKYNKEPKSISDDELQALLAYGIFSDVKEKIKQGRAATIGGNVMESLPFIEQFLLGGGVASSTAKLTAKKSLQYGLSKSMTRILAGTASAIARTPFMATMIGGNIEQRMTGNIDVDIQDGVPVPVIREGTQEGLLEAGAKSWVQAFTAVASEGLGEAMIPARSYLLKKIGFSGLDDYMKALNKTDAGKIMKSAQIQGIPIEFSEEIANKYMDKLLLNEGSWGFEEDELLNTLLTVTAINGAGTVTGTTQIISDQVRLIKEQKNSLNKELPVKIRIDIDKIMDSEKPVDEMGKELNDYISMKVEDEELNRDQVKLMTEYATSKIQINTINDLQELKQKENEKETVQQAEAKGKTETKGLLVQPSVETETKPVTQEEKPVSELPDNVIETEQGLFELNEFQIKQRDQMREKYGKERADELITMFVDINDLHKYNVSPDVGVSEEMKKEENEGNTFKFENNPAYIGIVDLTDGTVISTYNKKEVEESGKGKHANYLDSKDYEMVGSENFSRFKVTKDGKVIGFPNPIPKEISQRIEQQIKKTPIEVKVEQQELPVTQIEGVKKEAKIADITNDETFRIIKNTALQEAEGDQISKINSWDITKSESVEQISEVAKKMGYDGIVNKDVSDVWNKDILLKNKVEGKKIEPVKEVKANKTLAIKEVIKDKGIKEMEAGFLLNKYGEGELVDEFEEGLSNAMQKKLENGGYIEYDGEGKYKITEEGNNLIKAINARLQTRKQVKSGTDLFPETANIPELETKKQEEPNNAEKIRKNEGQIQGRRNVQQKSKNESSKNLQQPEETGTETGNKKETLEERVENFRKKEDEKKASEPEKLSIIASWKLSSNLWERLFSIDKGAPKGTAKRALKMKGRIKAQNRIAESNIRRYSIALKNVYGRTVPKAEAEKIDNALKTMGKGTDQYNEALKGIDERLHESLIEMRRHIDHMTLLLQEIPWLSNELQITFDANTGYYVTRSYQAKNNPNWTWENINQDIKDKAFRAILQNFPELTDQQAIGLMKSMLLSNEVSDIFGGDATLGKMNLGITKQRSKFLTNNPAIRDFLGEFKDPVINYATSINKMVSLLEKHRFLTSITEQGVKTGVFTEEINEENNVKVGVDHPFSVFFDKELDTYKIRKGKTYKNLKPINEYYTTPEIKQALEEFDKVQNNVGILYKIYLSGTSAIKGAKTAGSIRGILRNFWSNPINSMANANWNVISTLKEIPLDFSSSKSFRESFNKIMVELDEEGILGQNIDKRGIEENIREISRNKNIIDKYRGRKLNKIGQTPIKIAWKAFSFGDDFWKVQRYFSEKSKYRKVYDKTMNKEEAEKYARDKASDILHDTQAFYDLLPNFAQAMRKAPVTGSFISFPYVTTMNIINTIKLSKAEMSSKDTFSIGLQRAIGTVMALSLLPFIAGIKNDDNDIDEEEMQLIRRFLAPYWKNDVIAITKNKGNGVYTYSNLSFVDFYSAVTKPGMSLIRDLRTGDFDDKSVIKSFKEFIEPYADPEISAQIISDLMNNHSKKSGRKIYDPNSETMVYDIVKYIWNEGLMPGTINDIKRIKRMKRHDQDWQSHMKGMLTGFQKRELDIKRSFKYYNIKDYLDDIQFYRSRYNDTEYKEGGSKAEKALNEANENINRIISEARKDYDALIQLGVKPREAAFLLKETRNSNGWLIPKIIFMSIYKGYDIKLNKEGKFEKIK